MRRSLTVTDENDKKILLTKGRFLTGEAPFDIDYTTMVNILIELGHKLMISAWGDSNNPKVTIDKTEIIESFKKHFFNAELKEEAVERTNLPRNEQIQREQIPVLPADKPKSLDTKKEKYIS